VYAESVARTGNRRNGREPDLNQARLDGISLPSARPGPGESSSRVRKFRGFRRHTGGGRGNCAHPAHSDCADVPAGPIAHTFRLCGSDGQQSHPNAQFVTDSTRVAAAQMCAPRGNHVRAYGHQSPTSAPDRTAAALREEFGRQILSRKSTRRGPLLAMPESTFGATAHVRERGCRGRLQGCT
jgi:hypothetical protein